MLKTKTAPGVPGKKLGGLVIIVIPAYNEVQKIADVVGELNKAGFDDIVVVDDGSSDGTASVLSDLHVHNLRHPINCGQGVALSTGITYALALGAETIVTFDADGQHQAADVSLLVNKLVEQDLDVVFGSRFLGAKSDGLPLMRMLMLKAAVVITNIFYGVKLTDTHNGLRAFSRQAAEQIKISEHDMVHASQIIETVAARKLKYAEVPVTIAYTEYSLAKGQKISNSVRIFIKMIWRKFAA